MTKDIRIGGEVVPGVANALTPVLYRNIFNRDFMVEISSFAKLKGKKPSEYTTADTALALERSQAFARLAFIMKEQAIGKSVKELVKLTEFDFFEWLTNYEPTAFDNVDTIADVLALWSGNAKSGIEAKNA